MPTVEAIGTSVYGARQPWPPAIAAVRQVRQPFSMNALSAMGVAAFVAVTAVLLLSGRAGALTLIFPAMAVAVGALLLFTSPPRFVAFALWLFMLSPFVRRVVDEQHGWNPQNPILLAPLLVCALALADIVHWAPRLRRVAAAPFVLAVLALAGGVAVGLFLTPPLLVIYAALSWVAPILLGLHVVIHPELHARFHRAIAISLGCGVVVMGLYGVYQFVSPTLWDRLWMINSRMDSIGQPLPLRVRVFSTMNAPGPLAQFLSASVLILLTVRSSLKWPGVVAGLVVFLLSLARSAWLGFAIGFVALVVMAPLRIRRAAMWVTAVATLAVITLSTAPLPPALDSMRETIARRLTSISDLSMDDSFRARRYLVPAVLTEIAERPLGSGLGATLVGAAHGSASSRLADQGLYLDNGVLEVLLVMGWVGGLVFLLSALGALWMCLQAVRASPAGVGYLAATTALLAQVVGGTIFTGAGGAMFWLSIAMAMTRVPKPVMTRITVVASGRPQ